MAGLSMFKKNEIVLKFKLINRSNLGRLLAKEEM